MWTIYFVLLSIIPHFADVKYLPSEKEDDMAFIDLKRYSWMLFKADGYDKTLMCIE